MSRLLRCTAFAAALCIYQVAAAGLSSPPAHAGRPSASSAAALANLSTSEHNNVVTFALTSGGSTQGFAASIYSMGNGQCGHVVSNGQPYGGIYNDGGQITVVAGRHGTSGVANSFNNGLSVDNAMTTWSIQQHVDHQLPGALNFYVADTNHNDECGVGFVIMGRTVVCLGTRLGQGSADEHNNWWLGGPNCFGDGGTDTLNCQCTWTDTGESKSISFVAGPGDSTFNVMAACSNGDNCGCTACAVSGFRYFCQGANECHETSLSCSLGCDDVGQCVDTSTCVPPTTCSQIGESCGEGNTCCTYFQGTPANFSTQAQCWTGDVTCCPGGWACPANYSCDGVTQQCTPPSPSPSEECTMCRTVVSHIIGNGDGACDSACDLLGPLDPFCELAMEAGLCDYIMKEIGANRGPAEICDAAGACSEGSCACGYCSPANFAQWCLALDHQCPSDDRRMRTSNLSAVEPPRKPAGGDATVLLTTTLRQHLKFENVTGELGPFADWSVVPRLVSPVSGVCADGMCDAGSMGCCLTCAP